MEDTNKFGLVDKEGIKGLLKEFQYLNDEILSKIDNKEDDGLLQKLSIISNNIFQFLFEILNIISQKLSFENFIKIA